MNEQLKPCPFCGHPPIEWSPTGLIKCLYSGCSSNPESYSRQGWNTRADGWISVHDKKPKYGAPVILSVNDVVQDITYNLDGSYESLDWFEPYSSVGAYDDLKGISFFVTHDINVKWMQLPNPPKAASCGE